jgi:hypothetical protein
VRVLVYGDDGSEADAMCFANAVEVVKVQRVSTRDARGKQTQDLYQVRW